MTDQTESYNETTDLYLEILREAQRVEDKKLIQLIRRRLKDIRKPSWATSGGCEVILFPRTTIQPQAVHEHVYWPKFQLLHIAACLAAYLVMILGVALPR